MTDRQDFIPVGSIKCPYCGRIGVPRTESKISTGGWIVFAVLILACFIFCWVGLLMKENYKVCNYCNTKIA